MKKESFSPYDTVDYLNAEADVVAYLEAAAEDGDPQLMAAALGDVARARNISLLARETGLSREGIYKALSPGGNPSFATISKVSRALGLQLCFRPTPPPPRLRQGTRAGKKGTRKSG